MKTIGLIGGMSWVSTAEYYRWINQILNERLGEMHSAKILLYSVDFAEFRPDESTDWVKVGKKLGDIARTLQDAGADCILVCANTMHLVADMIQANLQIPLFHIAEETGKEIKKHKIHKAGLLGTRLTMEQPFLKEKLFQFDIETLIPEQEDRDFIHASIFNELGKGFLRLQTKERYLNIIQKLIDRGAEGIILGCTEIPLLIKEEDCPVPSFDTTLIHSRAAVTFALNDDMDNSQKSAGQLKEQDNIKE